MWNTTKHALGRKRTGAAVVGIGGIDENMRTDLPFDRCIAKLMAPIIPPD
jgi:hypothetical protein